MCHRNDSLHRRIIHYPVWFTNKLEIKAFKAVAVREGKILGVGNLDQLSGWGEHTLDTRFADKVLMPGFVEGHCHAPEGQIWNYTYLGYFERHDPEGNLHPKLHNMDEVLDRLRIIDENMDDKEEPLFAWGFDPIYYNSERMTVKHLDSVSKWV